MRVAMLLANMPYPPDIRVDKEANCLVPKHQAVLLCRGGGGKPAVEQVDNVLVVRHRVHPGRPLRRKFDSLRYLVTLDSPSWRRALVDMVRAHGCGAIHVHDLPYAKSAILAGREAGVPVVLDLHENYPAALALWRRRRLESLLFSPKRAEGLERWAVQAADRVVVVVDEAKDRLVGLGADPAKVVVFGNTEPLGLAPQAAPPLTTEPLRLVYVGGVAAHRGIDTVVEAMPAILAKRPDAVLTVVGGGPTLEAHKARAAELGLGESAVFTGQLPMAEAMAHVETASVCLVPHHRSPHTDATVPHKLFQYMAYGRPILVSDCAPLERIVRDADAGEVFRSGDAVDLAAKALALADAVRAAKAGANGRRAFETRWNLEAEAPILVGMYDGLVTESAR